MGSRKIILLPGYDKSGTILGLDCSSKTVGWGLVGRQPTVLVAHGHFNPLSSKHNFLARLDDVFDRISVLCAEFGPAAVAVEDIIQHMSGGGSMAQTITILAAFNRVAALSAWRRTSCVHLYPVSTIRKAIRIGIGRKAKIEKNDMPGIVREHLCPSFSDIMARNGKVAEATRDEADGIAVAWCHALTLGVGK